MVSQLKFLNLIISMNSSNFKNACGIMLCKHAYIDNTNVHYYNGLIFNGNQKVILREGKYYPF